MNLLLKVLFVSALIVAIASANNIKGVTYDGRSLIINGKRELLFSGSIHYPRSTPEMWPDIIQKAKRGGLNVIQTYVFWNLHEPVQGQFSFEGSYDLVKFIKLIHEHGIGFPFWLREIKNITFRSDNAPFKYHMKRFTKVIVKKMKDEKLYASQGGPIILSQIENEYNTVELAYKELGTRYVQWAGNMAVGFKTGVPWIMCKQKDAPDPVINTCNGRNCGDTFTGPNRPNKPALWTENWTAQYRVFGDPPSQRSAEDLAFSVARFFSKNGTLANYYMYHGGTNFARTGSSFVMTRYYDEAPLDEYGLEKGPKWGHLKDLHAALKLCRKPLLWGTTSSQSLGEGLEARVYEKAGTNICVAFLTNNNSKVPATVTFRGVNYYLPARSISVLPDCKTVVFNTQRVNAQHNARTFHVSKEANRNADWKMYQEDVPKLSDSAIRAMEPLELLNITKDTTDYLWYTTSFNVEEEDMPMRHDIHPVIQVASLGHAMHAFVNGKYIGSGHGNNIDKSFSFSKAITLKTGTNHISFLAMTVGLPDSGAYLEHRLAGIHTVAIQGLMTGTLDLSVNEWGHQVGVLGEKLHIYRQDGSHRVQWTDTKKNKPLAWYKRYFEVPRGDDPVALDMISMGKGFVWINGHNIGRSWVSYLSPLGSPSQWMYHIPRSYLKPSNNLMVVFEETGGDPEQIKVVTVKRDTTCSVISDDHPPHVKSWKREHSQIRSVVIDAKPMAHLTCPSRKVVKHINFASYGNPVGICGNFTLGTCHSPKTKSIVEKACLGKMSCQILVSQEYFEAGMCTGTTNTLAVQVKCGRKRSSDNDIGGDN
ncbi:Beta-galactosidase 11 [Acorus calamus]|uniref:Beta-galactosidase n=1 Tax=Acorus calamus TaxID=4465 RepID=A0AAV9DUK2_ACOCL|nr:Beta-galactosidase 11 [Acorus calamus]